MNNKLDFSISPWFADPEEPGSTGLFYVPGDPKDELNPSSKFESTIKLLELRVYHTLKYHKFGMFSESKKIIKQLYSNFKKYSSKLAGNFKSDKEKLKKMVEVEKLICNDSKKIESLLNKLGNSYNGKEEEKKPRIIKGKNKESLEKGIKNLLEFSEKCVDKQKELAMDQTKKGENNSDKKSSLEKLIKAFSTKNLISFIINFSTDDAVKAYTKKSNSETGKILKHITKATDTCKKAFDSVLSEIKIGLNLLDRNEDLNKQDKKNIDYIKEKLKDKNKLEIEKELRTCVYALDSLITILTSVKNYEGERKRLISLYDSRVKKAIEPLIKDLGKEKKVYEDAIKILNDI